MSAEVSIDLYADPRIRQGLFRLNSILPEADLSQVVRAAILYVSEGVPEHEFQVYLEEQVNLEEG